ncbi:uncharacterized protein LOC106642027 isoform X2 [Copidosoma floridanum]|uniref:uncharacterized protein LOC106642027 isoform X2 n=1 Tax=Copidosoma floridanum TaxID=29053 RepID=UPI0006C9D736|nr:uncharacterized protein LOC106642027 isoform X2 [Copidosoma floridanum]
MMEDFRQPGKVGRPKKKPKFEMKPLQLKEEILDDEPEVVLSNKGGPKLIHRGFMYTLHKRQPTSIRWRCVLRTQHCKGSLLTDTSCKQPYVRTCHSHPPDLIAAENARQRCAALGLSVELFFSEDGTLIDSVRKDLVNDKREHNEQKALRAATQNLVRQMRQIAPALTSTSPQSNAQRQAQKIQQTVQAAQQQQKEQQQKQRQQSSGQSKKSLLLKSIPVKVKPVVSSAAKMPSQAVRHSLQNFQQLPQTILPQQPTEVCLRWNSYHSNMQHSFPSLLDSEEFVDVTLACEGRSLKCHKMILSSCSDYLAQLLRENPCQHPIILMRDLKFWEVEALVKFMYRGEVNVTHDKLPQLLNAAETLQVKGLAGPSNTQNPKPPLLIPQPRASAHHSINRSRTETKDKPSTSTSNLLPNIPLDYARNHIPTSTPYASSILKRGIKRRKADLGDTPEARPFTKIRLQRPVTPSIGKQRDSKIRAGSGGGNSNIVTAAAALGGEGGNVDTPAVKEEPMDVPLSPGDHLYQPHPRDDDDSSDGHTFESIIRMHQEEDPGGENTELADPGSDYDNNDDDEDDDDDDEDDDAEHMEFVPTDFLEQEQNIVEEPEEQSNRSSMSFADDDSKRNDRDERVGSEQGDVVEEEDEQEDEVGEVVAKRKGEPGGLEQSKKDKDKT